MDIKGKYPNGKLLLVEVQGNKKPNGNPLTSSQRYTHYYRCIGTLCKRINEFGEDNEFAIGLPEDHKYRLYVSRTSKALKRLKFKIFWVYENEEVRLQDFL